MTQFPISRYLNVQAAYFPAFMSDGEHVVFISNMSGIPQVWKVAVPEHDESPFWPEQLTFEADRVQGVIASPVPGDNRIIYSRDSGGDENAQLYLLDAVTGQEVCLTEGYTGKMHIPGAWSPDGTSIVFAANRRHAGLFDLYVQPLDGEAQMIWQNEMPGYLFNAQFSPDGKHAAVMHMVGSFDTSIYEVDLINGGARLITPAGEGVRYFNHMYAPDGNSLLLATDLESDFLYLARLDPTSSEVEPLVQSRWDVGGLSLSPDGKTLAYVINAGGQTELYLHNLETNTTRQADLGSVPGVFVLPMLGQPVSFSPDSGRMAFGFISTTRTADIHIWDIDVDTVYPITKSSHGGLPVDSFVAPELIEYPTFDTNADGSTRMIPGWYYCPQSNGNDPFPVAVLVHGGPESQSQASFSFIIQYLLHNDYAVFVPNVRGSTGYGKAYSHLDDVEKRMDSVADLAHAAYWLKEQSEIDGDRIAVYGGSYGGFMVLSALTTYPDLWVAGVDIVGISNFVTFLENTSAYRRGHREAEYGSLENDREFLERVSPSNHVDKIQVPLMVVHGANDPRVPLSEAEQMVDALRSRDVPVEFLVFDDEGHGIVKLKNKLKMYPAVVDFLNQHMQR